MGGAVAVEAAAVDIASIPAMSRKVLKMHARLIVIGIVSAWMPLAAARAQFPEDALRLSEEGTGVGARALGMGNAFTAVADDYTALFWNPAGLAQLYHNEVSVGISNLSFGNMSSFFGSQRSFSNDKTNLDNFGVVYPVPTFRGSAVVALGYSRSSEFTTALSFDGFNTSSSIVPSLFRPDTTADVAYLLYLERPDGSTPIQNDVRQHGTVLEAGGINQWSAAGAIDVAKNFSAGLTLNFLTGSYRFTRNFTEEDSRNVYSAFPFDYDALELSNTVDSDITGFTAKFGMHYRDERMKLGLTVKTPSWFSVDERFSTDGRSFFDNGDSYSTQSNNVTSYDVVTPFVFSGGTALSLAGLTLSGDADYTDWTQMEFRNATTELLQENTTIKEIFRPTVQWRLGAQFQIPTFDVSLRGGFMMNPSRYRDDPSSFDRKYVTGGIGLNVADAVSVDAAYAHGWWKTFRVNYDSSSRTDEDVTTNTILLSASFRF